MFGRDAGGASANAEVDVVGADNRADRRLEVEQPRPSRFAAEVGILRRRLAIERSGHAKTVSNDGVVGENRRILVWPPFERGSVVSVGD